MFLQYQDPRLPLTLIVNNTLFVYHSLGVMDGFQEVSLRELDGVWEVGRNGKWDRFVAIIVIVAVVGTPHIVPLLVGFVGLQWAEYISIRRTNN